MRRIVWLIITAIVLWQVAVAWWPDFTAPLHEVAYSPDPLAYGLAAAFLFGFVFRRVKWIQHFDTLIHEFGHALNASLVGGTPKRIKLNADSSGVTHFKMKNPSRLRYLVAVGGGPLASSFAMLLTALLVSQSFASLEILSITVILLLVLLTTMRSVWGWVQGIIAIGGLVVVVIGSTGFIPSLYYPLAAPFALYIYIGIAAGVATRQSFARLKFRGGSSDEETFARLARLNPRFTYRLFILANLALVGYAIYESELFEIPEVKFAVNYTVEAVKSLIP